MRPNKDVLSFLMNVLIWLLPKNELHAAIESVSC